MQVESSYFFCDGLKLDSDFWTPFTENEDKTKPYIIVCSGYTGLKNIHPARFARFFTKYGFPCFGFDYRGWGKSEGEKDVVLLEDQVRDIISAVSFVGDLARSEGRKIVLAGWGMSAGLCIEAARCTNNIDYLVAMNGFYNNIDCQKTLRGEQGYQDFVNFLDQERALHSKTGEIKKYKPFDIYPLDSVSEKYVFTELTKFSGYGSKPTLSFADSILAFDVLSKVENCDNLKTSPLLVAHGSDNLLHPLKQAVELQKKYCGEAELFVLEGAGHTEWMLDENPLFKQFSMSIVDWINKKINN